MTPDHVLDSLVECAIAAWNAGGSKRPRHWLYQHGGLKTCGALDKRYRAIVLQARAATVQTRKPDPDAGAVFPGQFIY